MNNFNDRAAMPAENELADLQRRHVEMVGQLEAEQGKAAQVEAELLTGKAEIGDVTTARQRCAVLQDAVDSLQAQVDVRMAECTAQWRLDEVGRILAGIGDRTRALEARRVRCRELHDEGVEALRTIAGKMAEESAAYTQECRELGEMLARLRDLRAASGVKTGSAGEAATELPPARVFSPRADDVANVLSASVRRAYDAAVKQRVSAAHAASMVGVTQGFGPGGFGDPLANAKGIR